MAEKYQLYHLFSLVANFYQILKKMLADLKDFFNFQCTPLNSGSECPSQPIFVTYKRLSSVVFDEQDIFKIIRALNINKSHSHDDISKRMIKMCDSVLVKPLSVILNNCVRTGTFPYIWKKSCVIPAHLKKYIRRSLTIIDLFHNYLYLVKYLKGEYLITSAGILMNIICLILTNQGLDQMIHLFIN